VCVCVYVCVCLPGYDGANRLNDFVRFRFGSEDDSTDALPSTLVMCCANRHLHVCVFAIVTPAYTLSLRKEV